MNFYLDRAAKTRFVEGRYLSDGEVGVERFDIVLYRDFINRLEEKFMERPLPPKVEFWSVFEKDADFEFKLRRDVFDIAYSRCNMKSMPGYPWVALSQTNRDVPNNMLYDNVSQMLRAWLTFDINCVSGKPYHESVELLFKMGVSHPSATFVKNEATDSVKQARLIYGVSLTMNVIGRILFGDYYELITKSWSTASHKVGIDFYTESGLKKFHDFIAQLGELVCNDVQGWEYQERAWMHVAWHDAYGKRACADEYIAKIYHMYMVAELYSGIVDSDGHFHTPPFYFCRSGRFLTHLQNSDERAALGEACSGHRSGLSPEPCLNPVCCTNGDDYVGPGGQKGAYEALGFVLTEVQTMSREKLNFSSQIFTETEDGSTYVRRPEGLAKLFCNAYTASSEFALADILSNVEAHPGAKEFHLLLEKAGELRTIA